MPFEKGNQLAKTSGGGRKGYELEQKQLNTMREIVDTDLGTVKKIYAGKATERDFKILAALQVRVSKYLDKLHASKQQSDHNLEGVVVYVSKEGAEKYDLTQNSKPSI